MDPEHGAGTDIELNTHPVTAVEGGSTKKIETPSLSVSSSSSSSSSSASTFYPAFEDHLDTDKDSESTSGSSSPSRLVVDAQHFLAQEKYNKYLDSTTEQCLNNASATQSAPDKDSGISVQKHEQRVEPLVPTSQPLPIPVSSLELKNALLTQQSFTDKDPGISRPKHEQCDEILQPTLPLPIPVNTTKPSLNNEEHDEPLGPTLIQPPVNPVSTLYPSLENIPAPKSPLDKDYGFTGPKPKLCDEYSVATLPSPAVTNSTSELSLHHVPTMQSPSVQVMERPAEPDKYRIPSSVFSKTSTAAPVDWSIASNESLFSIHTGNMSFVKEQLMFVGKSGELGYLGDPLMSGPHNNFSSTHLPANKTAELCPDMGNLGEEVSVIEAAAETMKEVLRENANTNGNEAAFTSSQVPDSGKISTSSDESMSSHDSFAFPILTGDGVKSGSPQQQPQKPPSQPQLQAMPTTAVAPRRRWFFCFSCCQYGS